MSCSWFLEGVFDVPDEFVGFCCVPPFLLGQVLLLWSSPPHMPQDRFCRFLGAACMLGLLGSDMVGVESVTKMLAVDDETTKISGRRSRYWYWPVQEQTILKLYNYCTNALLCYRSRLRPIRTF